MNIPFNSMKSAPARNRTWVPPDLSRWLLTTRPQGQSDLSGYKKLHVFEIFSDGEGIEGNKALQQPPSLPIFFSSFHPLSLFLISLPFLFSLFPFPFPFPYFPSLSLIHLPSLPFPLSTFLPFPILPSHLPNHQNFLKSTVESNSSQIRLI